MAAEVECVSDEGPVATRSLLRDAMLLEDQGLVFAVIVAYRDPEDSKRWYTLVGGCDEAVADVTKLANDTALKRLREQMDKMASRATH